ncbi:MAG: PTS sugar transporter subunit IIA [Planctomycetes bacterium]|nr:PTS sugar transporter subunit IIA [Planctomycetota bacterium]
MKISEILTKDCVCVSLEATDKVGAITELVDLLDASGRLAQRDNVLSAVLAREDIRSTAIAHGLAVPHGKSSGVTQLVMAIGKPATPIDFGPTADHPACSLIVLLASPLDKAGPHIQALAGISRFWLKPDCRDAVFAAATADELYDAFGRYES